MFVFKKGLWRGCVCVCVSALGMFLTAGRNQVKDLPRIYSSKSKWNPPQDLMGKRTPVIDLMRSGAHFLGSDTRLLENGEAEPAQGDSDGLKNVWRQEKAGCSRPWRTATCSALIDPNKQALTFATLFSVPLKLFPGRICYYGFIDALSTTEEASKPNNDLAGN